MAISCVVVPKDGATRDDLKKLAAAFLLLLRLPNVHRGIDAGVLSDLLVGKHPEQAFAPVPGGISLTVEGTAPDRQRAVQSLRECIPAKLVKEVLVEGRGWNKVR